MSFLISILRPKLRIPFQTAFSHLHFPPTVDSNGARHAGGFRKVILANRSLDGSTAALKARKRFY